VALAACDYFRTEKDPERLASLSPGLRQSLKNGGRPTGRLPLRQYSRPGAEFQDWAVSVRWRTLFKSPPKPLSFPPRNTAAASSPLSEIAAGLQTSTLAAPGDSASRNGHSSSRARP
jgi:hypothetical protein